MQRALRITPIRKAVVVETRDTVEKDGKKYREHIVGVTIGEDEKTGMQVIVHAVGFHRIRSGPRIPRDKLTRTRGKYRR